jgi:ABC-type amino acid transport substrate-binding protein
MKKIMVLLLSIVMLTGCQSKVPSDSLEDGVLSVGLECDYAPHNWTTTKDLKSKYAVPIEGSVAYCEGYDVMLAQKLADALHVKLKIRKTNWDGLISALNSGQIDAIIAGMSPTPKRKQAIAFTKPYYQKAVKSLFVVRKDGPYAHAQKLSDFKGARLTTQQGILQTDLLKQVKDANITSFLPDYPALMMALDAQAIDGYLAEEDVALKHIGIKKDFKIIRLDPKHDFKMDPELTNTAIGVRLKDTKLKKQINHFLDHLSAAQRQKMIKETDRIMKGE